MPDPVLLILAETLAAELLKAGYRSLGRIARGSLQYAALEQAWTEALQATLAGLLPDFDQNERDHLEGVFRVYIQAPSVAENLLALALVDSQPDMALLTSQFSSCDLDHDSLFAYYQLRFSTWLAPALPAQCPLHRP